MPENRKVTTIPPTPKFISRVGLYCRVSTKSEEQLNSLSNQISYLTRLIAARLGWQLVDIYIDIKPGSNTSSRNEFQRMMDDCQAGKLDVVVTKSVSRFGRNTVETLHALNKMRSWNIDVYFENEELHTKDGQSTFIISVLEGIAQEENTNRSQNISWGILRKVENGNAQILRRKCYGYYQDEESNLQIQEDEAVVVRSVFDMYLQGASIVGIVRELEKHGVKSPTGKDRWCKRTIETMLSNEKYTGNVVVFKSYNFGFPDRKRRSNKGEKDMYIAIDSNPEIISKAHFEKVQEEKARRSNVIRNESGSVRKKTHYSTKRDVTHTDAAVEDGAYE